MRVVTGGRQVRSVLSAGTSVISTVASYDAKALPINAKGILADGLPLRARARGDQGVTVSNEDNPMDPDIRARAKAGTGPAGTSP